MGGVPYRVVVAYANYRVGDIVHPPGVMADVLRLRGFIVRADEPAAKAPPPATKPKKTK